MSRTRIEDDLTPAKGNGATQLPSGTDAQRPTYPPNPSIRFNTTEEVFEMYDGQWRTLNELSYTVDVDYLVIAGGGSGNPGGGGGGAGGYRTSYGTGNISGRNSAVESSLTFNSGVVYTITVGAGGATMSVSSDTATLNAGGNAGTDSSLSGSDITTITSLGGGCGTYYPSSTYGGYLAKNDGGSGGGAVFGTSGGHNAGNTSGTSGQGFGGHGGDVSSASTWSGGGGGAGAAGNNNSSGTGGAGLASSITGTSINRGGGGSQGPWSGGSRGSNGFGGGSSPGGSGTANTGGGGGGGGSTTQSASNLRASGNGGSGVVILRLPTANYSGTTTGSPTVSTDGTDTILTFTSSGTYTA